MKLLKQFLRYFIFGITLFFLATTIVNNWRSITSIEFNKYLFLLIFISLILNSFAHIFSAWVWTWILTLFNCKLGGFYAVKIYLITNISKYIPGNIWHFVGRIKAIQNHGDSIALGTFPVVLEPLLMAIASLLITIFSVSLGILEVNFSPLIFSLLLFFILIILIAIHPKFINPVLKKLVINKGKVETNIKLNKYPFLPLIGELIFLLLRGSAFMALMMPFIDLNIILIPQVLTAFSFAWLIGLIVPGAPGGLGIFEAVAIASLDPAIFPRDKIIIVVALFRFSSIIAETFTAYLAWLLYSVIVNNE
ncbi:lysylphosphatidylglycerol synthase domain-containing protein [Cyanobacterium aponinum AL20118]|uniref:Lysylphosphatidylglycerol synthase domain-containing protein n=1 Tax=Cyanobacterium aponinum AL20115 TaxID=3090662 RepID=A0AAF1C5N3_9CHRO|nr:lysylphosphatidylglycerol synthase domain-containing protein [Cyanobacterium aponinum]WPF87474.1 lysylphosphatidylglycerol synthase domain-containing protein [Cyanobacterium aponinum AL20115]